MKSTPDCTPDPDIHDLPLATLQARADRACLGLREARARVTAHIKNDSQVRAPTDSSTHAPTDRFWRSAPQRMSALLHEVDRVRAAADAKAVSASQS
jgi:hypothetical protein